MDNMDTCCLEDQKKMDSNKVWQWRIMCGKEHSVRLEPFHHSNRIGLDFNVASNTQKQMDLQLVTNGVILEVCDFAKTVNKSKGHFITNILENNFDLGLENEQQLTDFTAQILHKVKHLIKKPPKDKKEVFTLFDTSSKPECKTNIGLNMASAERKTESFVVEMDDTDDSGHGDEYTCSQAASKEYMKTESLLQDMEGAHGDDSDDKNEFKGSGAMSAEELMEDASLPKFPYCEEICLNLDVGSKQSLDPGLLTKGVMLELVHFTKILTASFRLIVLGVLEHNFELDLKSQQGKDQIWFKILHLLKRRDELITTGSEINMEFTNELFSFQTNSFKGTRGSELSNMEVQQNPFQEVTKRRPSGLQSKQEKMALLAISERANKGHRRGKSKDMETKTLCHHTELCTTRTAEGDHCQTGSISEFELDSDTGNECDKEQEEMETENYHTCPQGESDLDSDKVSNSGNSGNQDHKSSSLSSDISRESEASCRDVCVPFISITDISSSLPIVNAKSMTYQPDERGVRTYNHSINDSSSNMKLDSKNQNSDAGSSQAAIIDQEVNCSPDTEHQNELKLKLWQLRANHIQRILSIPHEDQCPLYYYSRCKKVGIDFNVGSGVKLNLDPKLLTNGIIIELGPFATLLLSTQRYFITEILEYNFHLYFDDEMHRHAFAEKTLTKMRSMKKLKRSSLPPMTTQFELPDMRCIAEYPLKSKIYCSKCDQVRNHKNCQDESDSLHMHHPRPHTLTDAGSADPNCSAQKPAKDPSSTFSAMEEMIMDSYPLCKEIGLSLCVDKDHPKDKLDTHVLTHGAIKEVAHFTKRLCGTRPKIIIDVIQHNFNIGMQASDLHSAMHRFHKLRKNSNVLLLASWLNEVFVIQRLSKKQPDNKRKRTAAMHGSELEETIKKLKLTPQTQEKTAKSNPLRKGNRFPLSTEFSFRSGEEEKLDVKQMTKSVCDMDQEEMAPDNYYTCPLGESYLDSDEPTDLENSGNEDNLGIPKRSLSSDTSSIPTVNSNLNPWFTSQPDERGLGGGEEQTQTLKSAPTECDMEQEELGTENNMWKLRANRVKQILSAKELSLFGRSKKRGLEFNVGFGPKQNFSVDSLLDHILLDIAKFAITMNSSQQNFIMEILEYNFDISLESEYQRDNFTCEIMKRVRQLRDCEDAVKFSKEVFELHGPIPSISMANQGVASVNAELCSISRMEECDVACGFPPHSQAETKEHISQKSVDLHPFCKEIGLKLNVNNTRPNKKLDINKLTYGAMTEVTNFAERLCGTFEQICVDIVKHNLDLDSQCGDSDLARSIVARIPAVLEEIKLSNYVKSHKSINNSRSYYLSYMKLDSKNNPNSDAASAGSSQAVIIDQEVNSSSIMDHQNEFELKLWQLRANHIQQILSRPHEDQCLLYSYSRCKKLGIDFNVGSGVKQNLDPKLLTNGIMVEIGTFATALLSAQKYFITEILEYNFHLYFNNEMHRRAFAEKTLTKMKTTGLVNKKAQFELPDPRCRPKYYLVRSLYCPKCNQVRILKHRQDESDSRHIPRPRPRTLTDAGSADANCSAQKPAKDPSSTFSAIEEIIMDSYPRCKEIGLSLFVDKDQPKDKLDTHVLTPWTMGDVASFAKRLCGTNYLIFYDVLQHNFNIGMQGPDVNPAMQFYREIKQSNGLLSWLNEVFVIQPLPISQPRIVGQKKPTAVVHGSEWMERIKKRKLALQTKVKTDTHPSVVKKSENKPPSQRCYPICTEMGLDLDVTSKSGEKEKLDLERLTRAVVFEIYKFASAKRGCYFPHTVYEILDYNFDISSQHHRSWEFLITTASTVNTMVKEYQKYRNDPDTVFKLPFVFDRRASRKIKEKAQKKECTKYPREVPGKKTNKGNFVRQARYQSDETRVHFLGGAKINKKTLFRNEDTEFPTHLRMIEQGSQVGAGCGGLLQGNLQIKEEEYDPHYRNMNPEPDMEKQGYPLHDDVKTESCAADAEHLIPGETKELLGYSFLNSENENLQCLLAGPQGCDVSTNTDKTITEGVKY